MKKILLTIPFVIIVGCIMFFAGIEKTTNDYPLGKNDGGNGNYKNVDTTDSDYVGLKNKTISWSSLNQGQKKKIIGVLKDKKDNAKMHKQKSNVPDGVVMGASLDEITVEDYSVSDKDIKLIQEIWNAEMKNKPVNNLDGSLDKYIENLFINLQ